MNKITFTVDAQEAVVILNAIPMFDVLMSISEWWLDLPEDNYKNVDMSQHVKMFRRADDIVEIITRQQNKLRK